MTPSFDQLLHSAVIHFRQITLRFKRSQLCPLLAGIELDQNVAFSHRLARLEVDFHDRTRKVRTDHDAVNGFHRADHSRRRWPLLALRHYARHRLWWRLIRSSLHSRLDLLELHKTQGR